MSTIDEDGRPIKDEDVRRNIKVISARLCDLRERFMTIIQKINRDAAYFDQELSDEDETTEVDEEEEQQEEMSVDKSPDDSSSDEENAEPFVFSSQTQKALIEEIIERKARQHVYLQHLIEYPKILRYLVETKRKPSRFIPLRYVEPFIIAHVNKTPSGKIYDKIVGQIEDIRRNYSQMKQRD